MVEIQPITPSVVLGRLKKRGGVGRASAGSLGVAVTAISALDSWKTSSFQRVQVGDQLRDLLLAQVPDAHIGARFGGLRVSEPDPQIVVVEGEDGAGEDLAGLQ